MHKVDDMPTREIINEIHEIEARGQENTLDVLWLDLLKAERNLRLAKRNDRKKIETMKLRKKQAVHALDAMQWNGLQRLL